MTTYDLDLLVSQLNQIVNRASPEDLKIMALINTRKTLKTIGVEYVCTQVEEQIEVRENQYLIPERTVMISDVGFHKGEYQGLEYKTNERFKKGLVYRNSSNKELYFPGYEFGKLWALSWEFPVNQFNEPYIPEDAFSACKYACLQELAWRSRTDPLYQDRWNLDIKVEKEIRMARGLLNETSEATLRKTRKII